VGAKQISIRKRGKKDTKEGFKCHEFERVREEEEGRGRAESGERRRDRRQIRKGDKREGKKEKAGK